MIKYVDFKVLSKTKHFATDILFRYKDDKVTK